MILDFGKPKKDQCLRCETYKKLSKPQEEQIINNYENPIRRRDESFSTKQLDKKKAYNNNKFCSATFDLQSVLQIPSSDTQAIPEEFHKWYKSIPSCSKKKETVIVTESENDSN
ncbi:Uncharacterized protein FWK35_00036883 [Aphis craccivora]|uniref:Uncharacterized protein n=1 Tax=Aphis craccivora TaxID=307492 RepID=A0A6G0Y0P5_APHCR|nr:Uncharacterized protein FWK35_00036883 [Aphis craccivora]